MKAIAYSLFGYNKERQQNCFDFDSYFRHLMINLRMNRLIYPEWINILELDIPTYEGFKSFFDKLPVELEINKEDKLCRSMLWRLKPAFHRENDKWKYSHVLCRDLDSPSTYREAQAVSYWMSKDKAMHAITDSVSHNLPLMGGMIGVRPDYFNEKMGSILFWEDMMAMATGIDFTQKGSDQQFLNGIIYPRFAEPGRDSITQHYFNGMPRTFLTDEHRCDCQPTAGHKQGCPNDITISIPEELKESNSICGHIGASGYYEPPTFRFLRKHWHKFEDLFEMEKQYPKIFLWVNQ